MASEAANTMLAAATVTNTPKTVFERVQDPTSPYYLHSSEGPGLFLVPQLLNGPNYHSWSRAVTMALSSKNKVGFVDGSLPQPPATDPFFAAWSRCNTMVLTWLTRSLSPTIAQSILWFDKAADVWKDLRDRFFQGDIFRISDLQEEIYALKQGELSVSEYFTQLKSLWSELSNYRPLPPCTCDAFALIKKNQEEDYVIRFLKGLNDSYSAVKSQILLMDPLPPIGRVFSLVVQQERQMFSEIEHKALMTRALSSRQGDAGRFYNQARNQVAQPRTNTWNKNPNPNPKTCTHCGKHGHTDVVCYRKHGFPPGFRTNNAGNFVGTSIHNVITEVSSPNTESF